MTVLRMTVEQIAERAAKLSELAKTGGLSRAAALIAGSPGADEIIAAATLAKTDAPPVLPPRAKKRQGIQPAPPLPTEHEQQVAFFQWWRGTKERMGYAQINKIWPGLCFAVKNDSKHSDTGRIYRAEEGVNAGVPDVFLAVQRGGFGGLFLELKRSRKSPVSEGQKEYLRELRRGFYQAHLIVDGWEEAARIVRRYLENGT